MANTIAVRRLPGWVVLSLSILAFHTAGIAHADEPDPATYWDVRDIRPGMKGVGKTVMVGTDLEEFEAEVLGVMRGVSPGRDMILCRLKGCNLEHAGIIQGMSGSPIYIDGKLLGAVAYAWEFAKDPIAGVTPFSQMVEFVRSTEKRIAVEDLDRGALADATAMNFDLRPDPAAAGDLPTPVSGGGLGGMVPIATPLAATGFSPRALAALGEQVRPLGMAPMAGGGVFEEILKREGEKPLQPGSPMCVAMVSGDFDLSAIGTVTHVEDDRVYGFGHPMFSLGSCEFPLLTGYIHTVYPRASVSMKMGSPLRVVGVLDTDVSTGISGRLGRTPDTLPMTVTVRTGRFSEAKTFKVQIARHPKMMSSLVMSVLTSAIDTEGELPDELTVRLKAKVTLKDREPIELLDTVSGPRFSGPLGPTSLFGPVSAICSILSRNEFDPVRMESIDCNVEIEAGRTTAQIERVRLGANQVEPGQELDLRIAIKPFQGDSREIALPVAIPKDLPVGKYELLICDSGQSLRRRSSNAPHFANPASLDRLIDYVRLQAGLTRTTLFAHIALPVEGLAINDEALPNLPASARSVLIGSRHTPPSAVRADAIQSLDTSWVIEGKETLDFEVVRDSGLARVD